MSNNKKLIKAANSKGVLAKAVIAYQTTLAHYANESNWAVRGDDIVWIGDDDPTYAAQFSLGRRKRDPNYEERNKKQTAVREPDNNTEAKSDAEN